RTRPPARSCSSAWISSRTRRQIERALLAVQHPVVGRPILAHRGRSRPEARRKAAGKYPAASRGLAPRAGLEPATSWLRAPQHFYWARTISSPGLIRGLSGGCRALMRRYWMGSSASSLCTFLPTRWPFGRLRSGLPCRPFKRGVVFPEFTRCFNHSFLWKLQPLQPLALPVELPGNEVGPF